MDSKSRAVQSLFWGFFFSLVVLGILSCVTPGVTIKSPTNGSTVSSPVHLVATANGGKQSIAAMDVVIDGQPSGTAVSGGSFDEMIDLSPGKHILLVEARDSTGVLYQATANVTVSGAMANTPSPNSIPSFNHVYVVVEENHSYDSVVGAADMPYINSLIKEYSIAGQYYGNTHPSIGNYFMMTSGQVITNNDGYSKTVTVDNIVRELATVGKTWKSYDEGLPSVAYVGGNTGEYVRRHNPFSFYSDVVNDSTVAQSLVPLEQLEKDQAIAHIPNLSFIVPNLDDDAHDGTLAEADAWLQANIEPIIQSVDFQNNGLLIITFDEGPTSDGTHGGGRIPTLIVSSKVKKGFQSTTLYQHQNLLRLVCDALGVKTCPGSAATADNMSEFFSLP